MSDCKMLQKFILLLRTIQNRLISVLIRVMKPENYIYLPGEPPNIQIERTLYSDKCILDCPEEEDKLLLICE